VAFPSARDAVEAARTIQRTLADHRRTHRFAPQVRIGLHATEASRDGAAYRGRGVHEAARIGALAAAGEVLASWLTLEAGGRAGGASAGDAHEDGRVADRVSGAVGETPLDRDRPAGGRDVDHRRIVDWRGKGLDGIRRRVLGAQGVPAEPSVRGGEEDPVACEAREGD